MRKVWVLAFVLVVGCGTQPAELVSRSQRVVSAPAPHSLADATVAMPEPTGSAHVTVQPGRDEPQAKPAPVPSTSTSTSRITIDKSNPLAMAPAAAPATNDAFVGLGAWIDVFDHTDDPKTVVPLVQAIAKRGARTLYIESSRYTAKTDIQYPKALGAALDEAKARGMRVVAWYPPGFADVAHDLRRSLAAVRFVSPKGNKFDGFGADIEYTQAVPDHAERNKRTIDYTKKLRASVGSSYPMAAIVIPPTFLEYNKNRWPNFPWKTLAASYQLFMPMNYWTAFGKNAETATKQTKYNTEKTRSLTGRPVHIIGGLGDSADKPQTAAYVKAARAAGSIGGGLYDYTTTRKDVWGELKKLNG